MKNQFLNLNKVLKVDKLESNDEGIYFNEEQLSAIDQELLARAQAESARTEAETARTTAETALSNAMADLNGIDETINTAENMADKVAAIKTLLARKPGAKPSGVQSKKDPEMEDNGVDWETLNALPHMKETD